MAFMSDTLREIHRLNVRIEKIDIDLFLLDCTPMRLEEIQIERMDQVGRRDRLIYQMNTHKTTM